MGLPHSPVLNTIGVIGTRGLESACLTGLLMALEGFDLVGEDTDTTSCADDARDDSDPAEPEAFPCISSLLRLFSAMISEKDFMTAPVGSDAGWEAWKTKTKKS